MIMKTLKETMPVANKEHTCNWCGGKIVKGEKYNRQTILFDGRIYDWVSHLDGLELTCLLNMYDYDCGEGISEDTFQECVDEYIYAHHYDKGADEIEKEWQNLSLYGKVVKIVKEIEERKAMEE